MGGMATATLLSLFVIPAIFVIWKRFVLKRVNCERLHARPDGRCGTLQGHREFDRLWHAQRVT